VKKIQKGKKGEKIKMTKKQIGVKKAAKKNQKARNQKKKIIKIKTKIKMKISSKKYQNRSQKN
jgi:hypothetical protein